MKKDELDSSSLSVVEPEVLTPGVDGKFSHLVTFQLCSTSDISISIWLSQSMKPPRSNPRKAMMKWIQAL